jgi:hypothetical protein
MTTSLEEAIGRLDDAYHMLDKRLTVVETKLDDVHKDVEKMDRTVDSLKLVLWGAAVGVICNLIGVIIILTVK